MQTLNPLLARLVSDPVWEREWLDLLSQLEYVGCRKILKAVPYSEISLSVLQHISEEASHAFLLKAVATRLGLPTRSWEKAPLASVGWRYFQGLDAAVTALNDDGGSHYPAVSWAIERRVLEVYPVYAVTTRQPEVKRILGQILAQEKRHGKEFEAVPFPQAFRDKVIQAELPLWKEFCAGLAAVIPS